MAFARDTLPRLKEDIPAALFYITNWVYIVREVPYFEAFGRPPLLQQLWSLAVEEQFYLLWPLILLFLLRKVRTSRFGSLVATSIMIAISSIWMAILCRPDADPSRVYYATDTRAAGFLVGAMLAIIWSPWQEVPIASGLMLEGLGWSGLITLCILYNQLNEFQPFLYPGGILVIAVTSTLLSLGASSPTTLLSKFLETRPLAPPRPFEDSTFDEVMKRLLAHQVERVIFINVDRPIAWEYYINQKFAEAIARWTQAKLIDWDAIAHSEQDWFIKGQTHISYYGSKAYVAAIKK